jgi:hypothetical protein
MSRKRPHGTRQEEGNGCHLEYAVTRKRNRGPGASTSTSMGMDEDTDALGEGEDEGDYRGGIEGQGDLDGMSHQQMAGGRRGPHALSERYAACNPQPRSSTQTLVNQTFTMT